MTSPIQALANTSHNDRSAALARAFRAALTALSEPGRVLEIEGPNAPPPGWSQAAGALASVLVDGDAPAWIAPSSAGDAALAAFRFETGSAPAEAPESAAYVVGVWDEIAPIMNALEIGTPERPDLSTTIILEVASLDVCAPGAPHAATITGPGAPGPRTFCVGGVDARFWSHLAGAALRFPLGTDIFLTFGDRLMGLPRTVRLAAAPEESFSRNASKESF